MNSITKIFCAKYTSFFISVISVMLSLVCAVFFHEFWLSLAQFIIGLVIALQSFLIRKQTEEKLLKVNKRIDDLGMSYIDSPEYLYAMVDAKNRFLFGITVEGKVDWALGIPKPIQKELDKIMDLIHVQGNKYL